MYHKLLLIHVEWDDDAKVWTAASDDVPGLATEDVTMEKLIEKLKLLIPELLKANGIHRECDAPFEVLAHGRFFASPS